MQQSKTQQLEGLMIVGAGNGCGKTVVTAGLAAALGDNGFRVQALKPLVFERASSINRDRDQDYLNKVTQQFVPAETIITSTSQEVSLILWNKMQEQYKSLQYPCLLEAVGQVATPWRIDSTGTMADALDVAKQFSLSVLLVAKTGENFLAETRGALTFLQSRQMTPVGFIRVSTTPDADPEVAFPEALLISQQYQVPFLGDLPYSPSISVPGLQQGNLIRLIQENIDLLPLQVGMGLTFCT
jgi:dethiobiotin synthetase